jgi:isoleucyl-tRNA synthetase
MIEAFGELHQAGYLHKGAKPTRWCINCQTDLSETETEYKNHKLLSLYVKFPVLHGLEELGEDVYMVVWTNIPWTLPANTAITVHPDHNYVALQHTLQENNEILIMAANAAKNIMEKTQDTRHKTQDRGQEEETSSLESRVLSLPYRTVRKMKGLKLDEIIYAHPFLDRDSNVLPDRRVSLARGTGCVHATQTKLCYSTGGAVVGRGDTAVISAVDQNGQLTEEAGQFCGLNVFESGESISLELEKRGCLLASELVKQPYPHCSYCKKPIIVRVADKWILDLNASNLRQRVLKAVAEVNWIPSWTENRIFDTIAKRSDWTVSRRRIWGIPVPVFYCSKCSSQVDVPEGIELSKNMINRKGVDRWLTARPSEILSEDVICDRCGGKDFRWETDILDGEFISAMSHRTISSDREDLSRDQADICLGSHSQNEKWIQFSLLPSMAIEGSPPFKSVLIHGSVVDEDGKRVPDNVSDFMSHVSPSEDDAPSIQDLLGKFGADILRLWVTSIDCRKHLKMSHSRLELVSKVYRRVKNTCRFLLGNLSGYDPESDELDYAYLQEVDRWALHRLAKFIDATTKAFEDYQFHLFYRLLYNFCSVDMGSIYLSMVKRRLYTFPRWSSSRRAVQTVIYKVLTSLTRLIAPVLSFTAEEIWRHIPGVKEDCPSVYLSHWPDVNEDFLNDELESRWNHLLKVRSEIYKLLEKIRQEEGINGSSQASVILYAFSSDVYDLLDRYIDDLEAIFMVSKVRLMPPDATVPDGIWESDGVEGLAIEIRPATGGKCGRCWIYSDTVGTNEQYPTLCYQCIAILEGGTYYI